MKAPKYKWYEQDCFSRWRHYLCYQTRWSGWIKRQFRRKLRRRDRKELGHEVRKML